MDHKTQSAGSILTGVLLLVAALIILPLGIGLIGAFPAKEWVAGIFLLLIDLLLVFAAIRTFRGARRLEERNTEEIFRMKTEKSSLAVPQPESKVPVSNEALPVVLVNWTPTRGEWKQFVKWETRERKMNNILAGIGLAIGSALLIHSLREAGWGVSLIVGAGVAVIYSLISYQITLAAIGKPAGGRGEIVISTCSVLINNRLTVFVNEKRWATHCQILEETEPKILKIDYHWNTRSGTASEEIHIPIPKGKLGEAVRLVESLNQSFSRRSN